MIKMPMFVFDESVLTKIIEGKESPEVEIVKLLSKMKVEGLPFKASTTLPSLLRSIWQAESESTIENLQKIL